MFDKYDVEYFNPPLSDESIEVRVRIFKAAHIDRDCECKTCPYVRTCIYSWDIYNIAGDVCLADK